MTELESDKTKAEQSASERFEKLFESAESYFEQYGKDFTMKDRAELFGKQRQATHGRCYAMRPSNFFRFEERAKWEAWNSLGNMSFTEAKMLFIEKLDKLDPLWSTKMSSEKDDVFSDEAHKIDHLFRAALQFFTDFKKDLNKKSKLILYGSYKQATEGPCTVSKPQGTFNFGEKSKWESWHQLGQMSCLQAKMKYLNDLQRIDPDWCFKVKVDPSLFDSGKPTAPELHEIQEEEREMILAIRASPNFLSEDGDA